MMKNLLVVGVVLMLAGVASGSIISAVQTGGDAAYPTPVIEPEHDGVGAEGTYFQEDAWALANRTHEYNGVRFTALGVLKWGTTYAGDDIIVGLPTYLIGAEYISLANDNRDNAAYTLTVTVNCPSTIYLLIDNRVGNPASSNTTPPDLTTKMQWVVTNGFTVVNTGISPNGQPDFVGADEGSTPSPNNTVTYNIRTHGTAGLGTGAGMDLNQAMTVYKKDIPTGSITLLEQNSGSLDMYGVVVVPEPATMALLGLGGVAMLLRRRRK